MDLEEWEILPDDGFLEIHDDGGKKIFSRKYSGERKSDFQMNYFICPSPSSPKFVESTRQSRVPTQLVHVPIQLDHGQELKEINKMPMEINIARPPPPPMINEKIRDRDTVAVEADQDSVSQVFFKIKENEFVDMKMDSPRSGSRGGSMQPQIDFQFEGTKIEGGMESGHKNNLDSEIEGESETITWEDNISGGGLNFWKWSLNGVGAICSFGVAAAATICIVILGSSHKNKHNQNLRFQIYADDKRIKQMAHHATKLNEVISAARGVSMTRAHITYGGYYDGL